MNKVCVRLPTMPAHTQVKYLTSTPSSDDMLTPGSDDTSTGGSSCKSTTKCMSNYCTSTLAWYHQQVWMCQILKKRYAQPHHLIIMPATGSRSYNSQISSTENIEQFKKNNGDVVFPVRETFPGELFV